MLFQRSFKKKKDFIPNLEYSWNRIFLIHLVLCSWKFSKDFLHSSGLQFDMWQKIFFTVWYVTEEDFLQFDMWQKIFFYSWICDRRRFFTVWYVTEDFFLQLDMWQKKFFLLFDMWQKKIFLHFDMWQKKIFFYSLICDRRRFFFYSLICDRRRFFTLWYVTEEYFFTVWYVTEKIFLQFDMWQKIFLQFDMWQEIFLQFDMWRKKILFTVWYVTEEDCAFPIDINGLCSNRSKIKIWKYNFWFEKLVLRILPNSYFVLLSQW